MRGVFATAAAVFGKHELVDHIDFVFLGDVILAFANRTD